MYAAQRYEPEMKKRQAALYLKPEAAADLLIYSAFSALSETHGEDAARNMLHRLVDQVAPVAVSLS